jgi:hypothetical protein
MALCCKNISRFYNALARHRQDCCKNITRLKKLDPPRSSVVVTFLIITRLDVVANGGNDFSKGDLIMRKVLLATTALVAITGVTAAHADISISGNIEFEYESGDAADDMNTDGQIVINSSMTADNGVTYGVTWARKAETAGIDQYNASISSADMGTILLGNHNDNGPGMIDGSLGRNNDIESENQVTTTDTALSGLFRCYGNLCVSIYWWLDSCCFNKL